MHPPNDIDIAFGVLAPAIQFVGSEPESLSQPVGTPINVAMSELVFGNTADSVAG